MDEDAERDEVDGEEDPDEDLWESCLPDLTKVPFHELLKPDDDSPLARGLRRLKEDNEKSEDEHISGFQSAI